MRKNEIWKCKTGKLKSAHWKTVTGNVHSGKTGNTAKLQTGNIHAGKH